MPHFHPPSNLYLEGYCPIRGWLRGRVLEISRTHPPEDFDVTGTSPAIYMPENAPVIRARLETEFGIATFPRFRGTIACGNGTITFPDPGELNPYAHPTIWETMPDPLSDWQMMEGILWHSVPSMDPIAYDYDALQSLWNTPIPEPEEEVDLEALAKELAGNDGSIDAMPRRFNSEGGFSDN